MANIPPREFVLFILAVMSIYLWATAVLFWGIWIERYIARNGEKPASFLLTFFTGWGILRDYRTARKISARHGYKPWFLKCFEWLACLGMAGIAGIMIYSCVTSLR
jgi:hypothetical protein